MNNISIRVATKALAAHSIRPLKASAAFSASPISMPALACLKMAVIHISRATAPTFMLIWAIVSLVNFSAAAINSIIGTT